jgi:hypothetical protein
MQSGGGVSKVSVRGELPSAAGHSVVDVTVVDGAALVVDAAGRVVDEDSSPPSSPAATE